MNGGIASINGGFAAINGGIASINGGLASLKGGIAAINGGTDLGRDVELPLLDSALHAGEAQHLVAA